MSVMIPVMTINLGQAVNFPQSALSSQDPSPLPGSKSSGFNVQRPKADETRDDLGCCTSQRCLPPSSADLPVPFIKTSYLSAKLTTPDEEAYSHQYPTRNVCSLRV